jgi:hypothetical protein
VSVLHITNGDCAAGTLRLFLDDPVLITCDVLHDGPAPLVEDGAWYDVRARFLADGFNARYEETRAALAAFDRTVVEAAQREEIVLWFEHDLFDQLLLIRTLGLLSAARAPVSMICIGEFPGINRFVGLGQLDAEQLASLYPGRQRVSDEQFELARAAWREFRADDPSGLWTLRVRLKQGTIQASLPFLGDAIQRLFEEYPSTTHGLSRSAHAVLRELESGPLDGVALFRATQWTEARPFMGDLGLFDMVRALAAAAHPLVSISPEGGSHDLRQHMISLTADGREVLGGRADAIALNGIDEWRGGVHLIGRDRSPWRWDSGRETLVS